MTHIRYGKCEYNEETGESIVDKSSQYGRFYGATICRNEDKDIQNRWDGMYIADFKCDRQIQRARAMDMRSRAKGIQHAYNVLSKTYGEANEVVRALGKQVYAANCIADSESNKYHRMRDKGRDIINGIVDTRRDFREKHKAKK